MTLILINGIIKDVKPWVAKGAVKKGVATLVEGGETSKLMNAAKTKEAIEAAETVEAVNALVAEGEKRTTILKAQEIRIEQLS